MIKYTEVRDGLQSGDVLLVKARGIISRIIRSFTGESFNHAAMVISNVTGVFVMEMREGKGFLYTPMSQWLEINKQKEVYHGEAPEILRGSICVEIEAMKLRGRHYGYLSLIPIWISQFTGLKFVGSPVCSTAIQQIYEACRYTKFIGMADPGNLPKHLSNLNQIVWDGDLASV